MREVPRLFPVLFRPRSSHGLLRRCFPAFLVVGQGRGLAGRLGRSERPSLARQLALGGTLVRPSQKSARAGRLSVQKSLQRG